MGRGCDERVQRALEAEPAVAVAPVAVRAAMAPPQVVQVQTAPVPAQIGGVARADGDCPMGYAKRA